MQQNQYTCNGFHNSPAEQARCPICIRRATLFKIQKQTEKENFAGSSPAPFVGRFGYPNINVGILSPPQRETDSWKYHAPSFWSQNSYNIDQIVDLRSNLINSRFKANITQTDKLINIAQTVAMTEKSVDIEVDLYKKPQFQLSFNNFNAPMGPQAELKKIKITENPKIHTAIDKAVSDTDLKAQSAVTDLYKKGFDETLLTNILSVGTLGLKNDRKLVPTRWSITAIDDTLGKDLNNQVKDHNQINYSCYFGGYLGNYYLILFFPGPWEYELFETFIPKNPKESLRFGTDHENYNGRKSYAQNTAGGYYAARLAVLEKLKSIKRIGRCLALRFISDEYTIPLGVWVVREATRKSLKQQPLEFSDQKTMLAYAKQFLNKKFGIDIEQLYNKSILLKELKQQKTLFSF